MRGEGGRARAGDPLVSAESREGAAAAPATARYTPPQGARSEHQLALGGAPIPYRAEADWLVLRRGEKPIAEIFHVAYLRSDVPAELRPLAFVFNGGPGAASAYLHVGVVGPRRARFEPQGGLPKPPAKLVDNAESWLEFTDVVFVDPVGTGFSRAIAEDAAPGAASPARTDAAAGGKPEKVTAQEKEFYGLERDLESLGEFIQGYLSKHRRWSSPVFVAGESYGGFRAGKLARKLQEGFGVGLNGAILISPALELGLLSPSDYSVISWVDVFPSLAVSAWRHGRSRALPADAPLEKVLLDAERFACGELVSFLAQGDLHPAERRGPLLARIADYLGLPEALVVRSAGRVRASLFCRELLREERRVCGLYDAQITTVDPFPDRDSHEGPDPTLFAIERVFTGAINAHLRAGLNVQTEREYRLLSMDVNRAWRVDNSQHAFELQVGATDDLRYALSLNPHMKVLVVHGYYDLVTPYFSSKRLIESMKLSESQRPSVTLHGYEGGHMFYTRDDSRAAFTADVRDFMRSAL
jgi:carboxypeptidase C (cathepsin A)